MKKYIALPLAAALAFCAVSCGRTDEPAADIEASDETAEETTVDEVEEIINTIENNIPVYDKHAGINMKAEPITETAAIPDDWHEVSNGHISFMVPADVEYESQEYGSGEGKTYNPVRAQSPDWSIKISFYDGNNWEEKRSETEDYDYGESLKEVYPNLNDEDIKRIEQAYLDKGYTEPLDDTEESITENMAKLGLDYDGTRESLYRSLFEFDEDMRTDDNEEAFEYLAQLKADVIGMAYPNVYYTESDGKPVYIHEYPGLYFDPSQSADKEYKTVWIGAFTSPDMEYTALVRGHDKAEALQIASTIKIIG